MIVLTMEAVRTSETPLNFKKKLHGATTKKTITLLLTAVTTSNHTWVKAVKRGNH
jgi:hypothetical protein